MTDQDNIKETSLEVSPTPQNETPQATPGYVIAISIMKYVFPFVLTIGVVVFLAVQLARLPDNSPALATYLTPLLSLVSIWIPVKGTGKIAKKFSSFSSNKAPPV